MKNKTLKKSMRQLMLRCIWAEIAYAVAVMLALMLVRTFFDRYIWHWENPTYRFFKFVEAELPWITGILLLIGWILITWRFLSRMLHYLNEVAEAAESLASPTETPITLSDDLPDLENKLNLVREKALSNIRTAQEAEQRKNDLVIYLAHDLKTPLTSVIGYLTLLHDEGRISEELRQKYLSVSLEKAQRLEDLINEFFEIARFNLSNVSLNYSTVNMTRLLEQLIFEFQPMLLEKNLQCRLDAEPDLMIRCDADKMQRVFDNLLRNAVNYSFPGGSIEISGKKSGSQLCICFENSGSTIPRERLDRIFEQFYRLDTSRSSRSGGAGLGLAIAREITEHHGGSITAHSENNTVTFHVCLPVS